MTEISKKIKKKEIIEKSTQYTSVITEQSHRTHVYKNSLDFYNFRNFLQMTLS